MSAREGDRRRPRFLPLLILLVVVSWILSPVASAQESPTDSPTPTDAPPPTDAPSPTDSATPGPTPSDPATVTPSPSTSPSATPIFSPGPTPGPVAGPHGRVHPAGGVVFSVDPAGRLRGWLNHAEGGRHRRHHSWKGWAPDPRWGTYGTAVLDRAARKARRKGWDRARIDREIYAPFLVEGPATCSDTWGAPRWTGGYHPHHGQDVLCRYGAPVLAVQPGTIRFGTDSLGGRVAYLERPDGGFWYYAHLRSYAPDLASGQHVKVGRMIGRCGASGDATVPHVHFAYFTADMQAVDPMSALVALLRSAERSLPSRHQRSAEDPVVVLPPLFRLSSRAGAGPIGQEVVAEPVHAVASGSPRQRALGTAAFMVLFGSVLWGAPSRRRRWIPDRP